MLNNNHNNQALPQSLVAQRGLFQAPAIKLIALLTGVSLWTASGTGLAQTPYPPSSDVPPLVATHYRIEAWSGNPSRRLQAFDPHQIGLLEKLNRADRKHLARLREIVIPEHWDENELAYSPLPLTYGWGVEHPKALVVHQPMQAYAAYEYGRLVRWGPVSTGRPGHETPAGSFHLNWRSKGRHSTVNPRWFMPWYFNFQNARGLSFHAYDLPGHPASHACVRLLERDAQWLFDWGEQWRLDSTRRVVLQHGTPVLVVGEYDFDSPPPWRDLHVLANPVSLPAAP